MSLHQSIYKAPTGILYIVASEKGLTRVHDTKLDIPLGKPEGHIVQAIKELDEYFERKRTEFTVPLDFSSTPFQEKVWKALQKIPYGKTWSYKELALIIKQEKAIRAVGTANGRNPIWIIIPCHRVIAATGGLGGYAGGLPMKKKLLAIESSST